MSLSVGQRLRSAREQKKVSLEEACRVTKVQKRVLEAIEEGRVEEILNPAYARIFLKKYAGYLGLDGSAVMEEYLADHPAAPTPALEVETEVTRQLRAPAWGAWVVPTVVAAAGMIGTAFLVYLGVDLWASLRSQRPMAAATAARPEVRPRSAQLLVPLARPLRLTVRTTDKVWLQIKSDGGVIFQGVLAKGAQESWSAKEALEIWTGNASAMQLDLNGKPLEGLGRGVRKGVRVTHAGLQSP